MPGEELRVDEADDLVVRERVVAAERDAGQIAGEVVLGVLEAGGHELGAEAPVAGEAARVLGLLLGREVAEVEVDAAERPLLGLGDVDAGFVRPPLRDPALEELPLAREPLVCVLRKSHRLARKNTVTREDIAHEPLVWWPEGHGPGAWREIRADIYGQAPWPPIAREEPEEERIVSAVAEGAGVSLIMLERSRSLRVSGAVYRRFAPPEPTVGIALAWRCDDPLPTLLRLREIALAVAQAWEIERRP